MIRSSPLDIRSGDVASMSRMTPRRAASNQHGGSPSAIRGNELISENSNLKAKVNMMAEELNQARTIFEREQRKWHRQTESLKDLLRKKDKHIHGGGGSAPQYSSVLDSVSPARPHFNHHKSPRNNGARSPVTDASKLLYNGMGSGSSAGGRGQTSSPGFYDIRVVTEEGDDTEDEQPRRTNPFSKIMSLGSSHPLSGGVASSPGGGGGKGSGGSPLTGGDATSRTARRNKLLEDIAVASANETTNVKPGGGLGSPRIHLDPTEYHGGNSSFAGNSTPGSLSATGGGGGYGGMRAPSVEASVQAGVPGGGGGSSPKGAAKHVVVQTNPSTEDDLVSDLRHLNAELLKVQAQNAMLCGSVDMLKRDVADAASEKIVKRYEEMTMSHIRQLSRALENANGAIHSRDKDITELKRHLRAAEQQQQQHPSGGVSPSSKSAVVVVPGGRERGASTRSTHPMSPSQRIIAAAQDRIKNAAVGEGTDAAGSPNQRPRNADGSLVPLPPGVPSDVYKHVADPGQSDMVAALQGALDVTRAQLRCAMEELTSKKANEISNYGRLGPVIHTRTLDVGTQVAQESDIARTFTLYHQDYTQSNVERILTEAEQRNVRALMAADGARGVGNGALTIVESADDATQQSLRAARAELLSAHTHIEELEFALELERREKQRALDHVSGSEGTTVGEASRQAAHEIAFLCDTLNATRNENEQLHEQLLIAEKERQLAIQSLTNVKQRSEDVIRGCQDIADVSKQETESAIISLLGQLHQKTSELSTVRNTLTTTKRQNASLVLSNDALDKELRDQKMKVVSIRDAAAKVRDDFNNATVALRGAKQEIHALKSSLAPGSSPGLNNSSSGRQRSATVSRVAPPATTQSTPGAVPLSAPLQGATPDNANLSTDLERLAALGDFHEDQHDVSPGGGSSRRVGGGRAPSSPPPARTGGAANGHIDPSAEHLFQDLARYTPGAESPLQIVDGVRGHISNLSENVAELRRELKGKNERIQQLERQVTAQHNASRRAGGGAVGSPSSASRGGIGSPIGGARIPGTGTVKESYQVQRLNKANSELLDERDRLEDEVRNLQERCDAAERELVEGRALMMNLINEQQNQ